MEEENKVDTTVPPTETPEAIPEPSQEKDNIQAELDKVEARKKTRLEKLEYTKTRVEQQIADEKAKAGIKEDMDEDRPVTIRDLRAIQQETARETALTMAENIENEAERKLVIYHLENTIKASGDPQTDLRNARLIVNAVKNGQIVEETLRATKARTAGSAASAPPKEKQTTELTKDEKEIMQGFKLTEAEVLAARPKE